jgi:hypothetical protein
MKQLNEVVRMQQLAGINEIKVNNPILSSKLIKKPKIFNLGKLLINNIN